MSISLFSSYTNLTPSAVETTLLDIIDILLYFLLIDKLVLVTLSLLTGTLIALAVVEERKVRQLIGRECLELLELHCDAALVVNNPNLRNVGDGANVLTLLQILEGHLLATVVEALAHEVVVRIDNDLDLNGGSVLIILRKLDDRLVKCLLNHVLGVSLTQPRLGVLLYLIDHHGIELLENTAKIILILQTEIDGIAGAPRSLVGILAQTEGHAKLGKLNQELLLTLGKVHALSAHLILAQLGESDRGSIKLAEVSNLGRHCELWGYTIQ